MPSANPRSKASKVTSWTECTTIVSNDTGQSTSEHQSQGQAPWMMREAKANGEACYDQGRRRQIESRVAVRQTLWVREEGEEGARCQLLRKP